MQILDDQSKAHNGAVLCTYYCTTVRTVYRTVATYVTVGGMPLLSPSHSHSLSRGD